MSSFALGLDALPDSGAAQPAFPILAVVLLFGAFVSYAVCFALAASTKRLGALDYLAGTLGLFCGIGWIYFIVRANEVTLKHSFDLIEKGGDPADSRRLNTRFRIAAGIAIAFGVLTLFIR